MDRVGPSVELGFFVPRSASSGHLNKSRVGRNEREDPVKNLQEKFKMESLILAQGKRWRRA
jgi:hypothetical protein